MVNPYCGKIGEALARGGGTPTAGKAFKLEPWQQAALEAHSEPTERRYTWTKPSDGRIHFYENNRRIFKGEMGSDTAAWLVRILDAHEALVEALSDISSGHFTGDHVPYMKLKAAAALALLERPSIVTKTETPAVTPTETPTMTPGQIDTISTILCKFDLLLGDGKPSGVPTREQLLFAMRAAADLLRGMLPDDRKTTATDRGCPDPRFGAMAVALRTQPEQVIAATLGIVARRALHQQLDDQLDRLAMDEYMRTHPEPTT